MSDYLVIGSDGQQKGPFTLIQMQTMWAQGNLTGSQSYWKEGMDSWRPLSEISILLEGEKKTPVPQEKPRLKTGAVNGGTICFLLGLFLMWISFWSFLLYVPLFFVAFILSIVAMAQGRVSAGICLLLSTIIAPVIFAGILVALSVTSMMKQSHEVKPITEPPPMETNAISTNQPTNP